MRTINDLITDVLKVRPKGIVVLSADDEAALLSTVNALLPEETDIAQTAIGTPNVAFDNTGTFGKVIFVKRTDRGDSDPLSWLKENDKMRVTVENLATGDHPSLVLSLYEKLDRGRYSMQGLPDRILRPTCLSLLAALHIHTDVDGRAHTSTVIKNILEDIVS